MDEPRYYFRGDTNYRRGPIGLSLGEVADGADIQNPADHVLRKETRKTSRFASFTEEIKVAQRFAPAEDHRNVRKVLVSQLRELESRGVVRIWETDRVYEALMQGPKKLAKQTGDVRTAMRRNREVLIEGEIPSELIQRVD